MRVTQHLGLGVAQGFSQILAHKRHSREDNKYTSTVASTLHINTLYNCVQDLSIRQMGVNSNIIPWKLLESAGSSRQQNSVPLALYVSLTPTPWEHRTSEVSLSHSHPLPTPKQYGLLSPSLNFPFHRYLCCSLNILHPREDAKCQCCQNPKCSVDWQSPRHLEVFISVLTEELTKPQEWLPSPGRRQPGIFSRTCCGSHGFCKNAVT